jgi:hypothetical protein
MNSAHQFEHRASRSRATHAGESSPGLCDRLSRTRDFSQRQLPTDHDYAVPTREYQTDQSSLSSDSAAAGPVLEYISTITHLRAEVDRVTPYQPWWLLLKRFATFSAPSLTPAIAPRLLRSSKVGHPLNICPQLLTSSFPGNVVGAQTGLHRIRQNSVLYQGTTLVGPKTVKNKSGFRGCGKTLVRV